MGSSASRTRRRSFSSHCVQQSPGGESKTADVSHHPSRFKLRARSYLEMAKRNASQPGSGDVEMIDAASSSSQSHRKRTISSSSQSNGGTGSGSANRKASSSSSCREKRRRMRPRMSRTGTDTIADSARDRTAHDKSEKGKERKLDAEQAPPESGNNGAPELSPGITEPGPSRAPSVERAPVGEGVNASQEHNDTSDPGESSDQPSARPPPSPRRPGEVVEQLIRRIHSGDGNRTEAMSGVLTAMLSDALTLRARSANPANQQSTSPQVSAGGSMTVVVQGAWVERGASLPSRGQAAQPEASAGQASAPDGAQSAGTESSQEAGHANTSDPADTGADGSTPAHGRPSGESADTHLFEEQQRILPRLVSISAAATAAALVRQGPPAQRTRTPSFLHAATNFEQPATVSGQATSEPAQGSSRASADESISTMTMTGGRRSRRSSLLRSLRSGLASIRSRLPSFDMRFRGRNRDTLPSASHRNQSEHPPPPVQTAAPQADNRTSNEQAGDESFPQVSRILSGMLFDAVFRGAASAGDQRGDAQPGRGEGERAASAQSGSAEYLEVTRALLRDNVPLRGESGPFAQFLTNLSSDLGDEIRQFTTVSAAPVGDNRSEDAAQGGNATADGETSTTSPREEAQSEHLTFFRFYAFPSAGSSDGAQRQATSSASNLRPCVLIGVRSLGRPSPHQNDDQGISDSLHTAVPQESLDAHGEGEAASREEPAPTTTRFVFFVTGGYYPPDHPLFRVSTDEATRDLFMLMEVIGLFAALRSPKPTTTVSADQIANSNLREVNGTRAEIETLKHLHQVMENTSERCLICLDDWQDLPEGEKRRLLDCGHLFHAQCLDEWLTKSNNSCPLCRRQAVTVNGAPTPAPMPPPPTNEAGAV